MNLHRLSGAGSAIVPFSPARLAATFLCLCTSSLFNPGPSAAQAPAATVWRDDHGIPHIKATTDVAGYRALGYEHARDQLFQLQCGVKTSRGQGARYLGPGAPGADAPFFGNRVFHDAIVKLHGLYLGDRLGFDHDKLKALLRRTSAPSGREDQVYLNSVAYAEGLELYRQRLHAGALTMDGGGDPVALGLLNVQEREFILWLNSRGHRWVYEDAINVFDVSSGPTKNGVDYVANALSADPTGGDEVPPAGFPLMTEPVEEVPTTPAELQLPGVSPQGSNAFAWSGVPAYPSSGAVPFFSPAATGLMADAHGPFYSSLSQSNPEAHDYHEGNRRWFVQLMIEHADQVEDVNVFGYKAGPSIGFGSSFTKHLAVAGSLGAGNSSDAFLLRLKSHVLHVPGGPAVQIPEEPLKYFDPYTSGFEPLVPVSVTVQVLKNFGAPSTTSPDLMDHTIQLYQAGSWGLVVHTTPSYADDTKQWSTTAPNKIYGDSGANRIPVVVSLRSPLDPQVNWKYALDATLDQTSAEFRAEVKGYERLFATSVLQIRQASISHELNAGPNTVYADRSGRLFAILTTSVPRRGNDAKLLAPDPGQSVVRLEDKFFLYDKARTKAGREPVPMRWIEDLRYDWFGMRDVVVDHSSGIAYLTPEAVGPSYMPYVLYDPVTPSNNHPALVAPEPNPDPDNVNPHYENPAFVTASNEAVHKFFQKSSFLAQVSPVPGPTDPDPNAYEALNNQLLQNLITSGTLYYSRVFDFRMEALEKNQNIIDFLADTGNVVAGPRLPMTTPDQAKSFGWDNRNHVAKDYLGYHTEANVHVLTSVQTSCPVLVRNVVELHQKKSDVLAEAAREERFFADLWNALFSTTGNFAGFKSYPLLDGATFNLKRSWVFGNSPLFWFPTVAGAQVKQDVTMPAGGPLIDFYWRESRIGSKSVQDGGLTLSTTESAYFDTQIEKILSWKKANGASDPGFRNSRDSSAALLALEYELGFSAASNGVDNPNGSATGCGTGLVSSPQFVEGRMWTPLYANAGATFVSTDPSRFPCPDSIPPQSLIALNASGALPSPVDADGKIAGNYLVRVVESYEPFKAYGFSTTPRFGSIMEGLDPRDAITHVPLPPYTALYQDPSTFTVKTASQLSKDDVNRIVKFFLQELGGFTLVAGPAGSTSTTSKKAAYEAWMADMTTDVSPADGHPDHPSPYSDFYPLTRSMVRVTVMRRFLEAAQFIEAKGLASYGDVVRVKVYDYAGVQRWPTSGQDVACEGGSIRAVTMAPSGYVAQGFKERMVVGGGSHHPMLVGYPLSGEFTLGYFNCYPGDRISAFSSPYFANCMDSWAARQLLDTYFDLFATNPSTMPLAPPGFDPAFPANPYSVP